jgi:hypothetical protein
MKKTWIIHTLERLVENGFVFNVHWRYAITDTDESGREYYADSYSVASFTQDPESEDYIPYEDLTEEIVINWVKGSLGEEYLETMENNLLQNIQNQKNPPVLSGVPWQSSVVIEEEINTPNTQGEEVIDNKEDVTE